VILDQKTWNYTLTHNNYIFICTTYFVVFSNWLFKHDWWLLP